MRWREDIVARRRPHLPKKKEGRKSGDEEGMGWGTGRPSLFLGPSEERRRRLAPATRGVPSPEDSERSHRDQYGAGWSVAMTTPAGGRAAQVQDRSQQWRWLRTLPGHWQGRRDATHFQGFRQAVLSRRGRERLAQGGRPSGARCLQGGHLKAPLSGLRPRCVRLLPHG
ncbi:hypothetical protein HPB50_016763 [Hyalomma asiaticum]|uniref:Uncharacterized protein n=1 Tax=Hyalomma asiaticum TaxID=266040 RepID=A0ACB7SYZ6_HYAAI|nr:hypothetical protein HPB50_016763 [Hyalomma asiaticum]